MARALLLVAAGFLGVVFAKRVDINAVVDHAMDEEAVSQAERVSRNEKARKEASLVHSHYHALGRALPPGYEDELYCPPEFCMQNKPRRAGWAGPRSGFFECKHKAEEKDPLPVTSWGSKKPAADKEQLMSDKYHQEECPRHDDGEDKPEPDVEDASEKESPYKCGAIAAESDACYPHKRDWIGTWMDAEACTTQCTKNMLGMCSCPNSGESCTSAMSNDPGLITLYPPMIGSVHYAIKMNKATQAWEFLSCDWEGAAKRCSWKSPHSSTGQSYMETGWFGVVTPNPNDIKIEGFETKADFCKPEVAAKYIEKLSKITGDDITL